MSYLIITALVLCLSWSLKKRPRNKAKEQSNLWTVWAKENERKKGGKDE